MSGLDCLLNHPEVASRSCEECKLFVFDETGKKMMRGGKPVKRPQGAVPPCRQCPKESPEKAHEHELSPRNQQVVAYYLKHRAAGGLPMDELTQSRLAIVDSLVRRADQKTLAQSVALELLPLFVRK